ncbi:MAG TPA: radical SAM protein, partial [Bacillota bacterium]|nr:radical SAM protein [Bacillota bacterium]
MNIGIVSLGCTKNQVDTEIMQGLLLKAGHIMVDNHSLADVLLVNTCGFIEAAKAESIQAILTAARHKTGRCRALVVAGCLSQRYAEELMAELPEIDAMVGTNTLHHVVTAIDQALAGGRPLIVDDSHYDYRDIVDRKTTLRHSVYVKIAEGCDNRCSYCAIPLIRGGFRSRPLENIEAEVRSLADKGAREINLIAQDTTRYGMDLYGHLALPELLRRLLSVPGPEWFRLLYCYPAHITDELIELMASEDRLLNYI